MKAQLLLLKKLSKGKVIQMKQYKLVIIDGLILLVTCVTIVLVLNNFVFAGLKKGSGSDSLVTMIQQDNLDRVKVILSEEDYNKVKENKPATLEEYKKARANKVDEYSRTPLMWLAYANNADAKFTTESDAKRVPMIEVLVAAGADLNTVDKDGWSALMWASWSGLTSVSAKLIELGADYKVVDKNGNTALMIAAQSGHAEIVKNLLDKGADRLAKNFSQKTAKELAEEFMGKFPKKAEAYKAVLAHLDGPETQAAVSVK